MSKTLLKLGYDSRDRIVVQYREGTRHKQVAIPIPGIATLE
jgi:hypothetical protein